jgi:ATP-dependent RNA helicase DDX5/DBP2
VRNLASDFLSNPLQVQIGSLELTANKNITQVIEFVKYEDKPQKLLEFIKGLKDDAKVLIFTETKAYCDRLGDILNSNDIDVEVLHGDKSQNQRVRSLGRFKDNHVNIMLATDVASRGLDVKNIDYVINYDLPENIDSYIHRIGRTGRAGNKGTAISYFTEQDKGIARELVKVLKDANQHVPEDLKKAFELNFSSGSSRRGSSRGSSSNQSRSSYFYENNQSRRPLYIGNKSSKPSSRDSDRYSSDQYTDSSKERRFTNLSRRRSSFDTETKE